jgi:hypothetical protein
MVVYFMTILNILWPFGIFCGHLLYFPQFGMFGPRKIWQPWPGERFKSISWKENLSKWIALISGPGANPTTTIYNARAVKIYNTSSLVLFENKHFLLL